MHLLRRKPRWALVAALTASVMLAGLSLGRPPSATAGTNYFCYANGNFIPVGTNPAYCAGNQYNNLNQVRWSLQNGPGVNHCALSKDQPNGQGHNVLSPVCGTLQHIYTRCLYFADPQWPKGTNESSSTHYYRGGAAYSFDCF
jgi:hypothetical protein